MNSTLSQRPRNGVAWCGLFLALALSIGTPNLARSQVYSPYFGNPIYGYGGGLPWALPAINFGTFNPGVMNFGVWDWYPGTGYYDVVNPYWYFDMLAADQFQGMASAGLSEAAYNVQSMASSSFADANSLVAANLQAIYNANAPEAVNHGERYDMVTGRAWSTGKGGGARLVDITSAGGDVLWPLIAPSDGDLRDKRAVANADVRELMRQFRGAGKVSVEKATHALKSLSAYADPACDYLRVNDPENVHNFIDFVKSLDFGIRNLAGEVNVKNVPQPRMAPAPTRPRRSGSG